MINWAVYVPYEEARTMRCRRLMFDLKLLVRRSAKKWPFELELYTRFLHFLH